jgi:hypothetical protein
VEVALGPAGPTEVGEADQRLVIRKAKPAEIVAQMLGGAEITRTHLRFGVQLVAEDGKTPGIRSFA